MSKFCKKCGRIMKNIQATHCSDECILSEIKNSKSLAESPKNAESWNEESDPWKQHTVKNDSHLKINDGKTDVELILNN